MKPWQYCKPAGIVYLNQNFCLLKHVMHIKWCETHSQRNNYSHSLPAICVSSDPVPRYNGNTAHHPKSTKSQWKNLLTNAAPLVIHVHLFNLFSHGSRTRKSATTSLESVHYLTQLCKKERDGSQYNIKSANWRISKGNLRNQPHFDLHHCWQLAFFPSSLSWSKAARKRSNCSCYRYERHSYQNTWMFPKIVVPPNHPFE